MRKLIDIVEDARFSPAFKQWFRNSKVVDEDGNPLVVYHGTGSDFDVFNTEGDYDIGSHFGGLHQASKFTSPQRDGANIMPVYLSIQNPLRLPDLGRWSMDLMRDELAKIGIDLEDVPYKMHCSDYYENMRLHDLAKNKVVVTALEDHGYDGIVYENAMEGKGDSWIVFHPNQVKSAIGNNGSYDSASDNIKESKKYIAF